MPLEALRDRTALVTASGYSMYSLLSFLIVSDLW
jgi:hypothetical protein